MDISLLREGLLCGKTYAQMARELHVSRQAVHAFCQKNGLNRQEYINKNPKIMTSLDKRKASFNLGPELYGAAAEKYRRKKQNCKYKKWEFTIQMEDIFWPTHCPILGLKLLYESPFDRKEEASISFDRIDSLKGYIPGNVQIISWRANRIKNDGTAEEHLKIANYLTDMINKV